jgi:hypothetical protein
MPYNVYSAFLPNINFCTFRTRLTHVSQEDGFIEYFNTIVVQPHKKLVTNQGRGYHVRCRYQTKDTAIISGFNVRYHLFSCTEWLRRNRTGENKSNKKKEEQSKTNSKGLDVVRWISKANSKRIHAALNSKKKQIMLK